MRNRSPTLPPLSLSPLPADSFAQCDVGVKCPKLRRPLPAESVMDRIRKYFLTFENSFDLCSSTGFKDIEWPSNNFASRLNMSKCANGGRFSFQLCRNNEAVPSPPRPSPIRVALWIAFARGGGKIGGSKGAK